MDIPSHFLRVYFVCCDVCAHASVELVAKGQLGPLPQMPSKWEEALWKLKRCDIRDKEKIYTLCCFIFIGKKWVFFKWVPPTFFCSFLHCSQHILSAFFTKHQHAQSIP